MTLFDQMKTLPIRIMFSMLVSMAISKRGYRKKSLNLSGAIAAFFVGFIVSLASYQYFVCLLVFFITSSFVTKLKSERKRRLEEHFQEGGQRNAIQVFCNGGIAAVISILYIFEVGSSERPIDFANDFTASVLTTSLLGTLSCCNGDTWSSELGVGYGSNMPLLITTFQRVPVGTNGGVSLVGLVASAFGGLVIGISVLLTDMFIFEPPIFITEFPHQWPIILVALFGGLVGSLVDSLLGAIFQYSGYCALRKKIVSTPSSTTKHISGMNCLNNHAVNFLASLIMAVVTPLVSYYYFKYFSTLY